MSEAGGSANGEPSEASLTEEIPLPAGTRVNVQRAGNDLRVSAEILGAVPGGYIILRDAHRENSPQVLRSLVPHPGDTLLVRFMHEGTVFGFRTMVTRFSAEPEYLLFVHYPRAVEQVSVRRYPRLACTMPCEVAIGGTPRRALLVDLSAQGCGIVAPLDETQPPPAVEEPVTVTLCVPGETRTRSVTGQVKRLAKHRDTWRAGVAFETAETALFAGLEPYLKLAADNWPD